MNKTKFEFTIGSDVDFEDLIADIGYGDNLVALLTQEHGFENMRIRLYPPKDAEYWDFRLDEFQEIITRAKTRMWELRKMQDE